MYTKRDLLDEAFAEIGIAAYEFDLQPGEIQTALRRLDTMMATWEGLGVRVGYRFPEGPDSSALDDESGLPDYAVETVFLNLAKRIAPGFGKTLNADTNRNARQGYDTLLWAAAAPIQQQLPNTMPRGAGNKPYRWSGAQFMPTPDNDPLLISQGGDLDILPE